MHQPTLLRRIMTTTAIYTVVGFIGPVVALLLTPLYTRALGVAGYGTVDLLQTFAHVAYTVAIIGMPTVLASLYRTDTADTSMTPTVVASALLTVMGWAVMVVLLLVGMVPWLATAIQRPETRDLLYLQLIAVPFGVVHGTLMATIRLREAIRLTAVCTVIGVVVTAMTRIVLVLWWSWGVSGMVLAAALTHIINAMIVLVWTRRIWWGPVDAGLLRTMWWRGMPLIPGNLAMWMLLYQDRWLLAGHIDAVAQGHYALAATLVTLLALVIDPFKNAWQPVALSQATTSPIVPTTLQWYVALAGGVALITGVWAPELLWVLAGNAAMAAAPLVWPLLLVPICSGALTIVGLIPTLRGQTALLAWSTLAAAALNTVLNLVLIPRYAAMGAGVATGVAAMLMPVLLWWQSQRLHPQIYAYARMFGTLALVVCGAVLTSVWPVLWVRILVCVGYLVIIAYAERALVRRPW